jgi:hypothetical protein
MQEALQEWRLSLLAMPAAAGDTMLLGQDPSLLPRRLQQNCLEN